MSNAGDGDKRTVATDALMTLGTIIGPEEKRDAIHLAVEPVIAGETLRPGEHIRVRDGVAWPAWEDNGLGIVDPFLTSHVRKGERFWFVMYPRQVRSLRHVWTHPAFPDADAAPLPQANDEKSYAEAWIRRYAASIDVGYNDLIESAGKFLDSGDYMDRGDTLEGVSTSKEFWAQYSVLTGRDVGNPGNFFSCSC